MKRRRVLKSLAVTGTGTLGALAGCLGGALDSNPNVTLNQPEKYSDEYSYPNWNDKLPDVTVPAPIDGKSVSIRNIDTPVLTTFFFSHCRTVCPLLIGALQKVQMDSIENGYTDSVTFVPMTFDPARDDAKRLKAYTEKMNIATDVDNWQFLRPKSEQRATEVIQKKFGVRFVKDPMKNSDNYMFTHTMVVVLANADGYVERAYSEKSPDPEQIINDLKKVR
ncbi:SCO family protein [Halocatena pleomorpha]|uniref:SCO family protein n=1 Tax=Halocatena pleomorpha TaxID=1785090 RepID=A0A3P3RBB7_9EURY|nr:SCO family protein [Halocatena pleomorpha]RRJ30259.1 SCO family protein [Halocatena pleomorpha]